MPKNIICVSVFISSPSNMSNYVDKVVGIMDEFNDVFGFKRGVIFRPVFWKKDIIGQVTSDAQSAINSQLMTEYDLLIGLVGDRLGDATARAESGTAEEIRSAIEKKDNIFGGKHVQVIFRTKIDSDMRDIDIDQIKKVKDFKSSLYKMAIVADFLDDGELDGIVLRFIESACRDVESNFIGDYRFEVSPANEAKIEPHVRIEVPAKADDDQDGVGEDFGFLDEMERSNLALAAQSELTGEYSKLIVSMTNELKETIEKYGDDKQKVRFDEIGTMFSQKAVSMEEITDKMRLVTKEHSDSFENVLLMIDGLSDDDKEALVNLRRTMIEAVGSIEEFIGGAVGAKESTENSPRTTQKFNKGKRQVAKALGNIIEISQYIVNRFKEYISYLDSIL